jgi:hypothetical protein
MAQFSLSPAVIVKEFALDTAIAAVSVARGAFAGDFAWGPQNVIRTVSQEVDLVNQFGKPNNTNFRDWLSVASFLAYAKDCLVVRGSSSGSMNSGAVTSGSVTAIQVQNDDDYEATSFTASTNVFIGRYPGALGNELGVAWADNAGYIDEDSNGPTWDWVDLFDGPPGTNQFHVVVYDRTGVISGEGPMTVLERYAYVSSVSTDKYYDGSSSYAPTVIQRASKWVLVGKPSLLTGTNNGIAFSGGLDGSAITDGERQAAWALFQNSEEVDINLPFVGGASTTSAKWVIDNIAEYRKDCVAFVSPSASDVVGITSVSTILANIKDTRNVLGSSSYAVMDSNYKYMYDRYNDVYRWVPLNGDIAGLHARTATDQEPWYAAGGYRRGRIKNAVKFAFYQNKTTRDDLYSNEINPCFYETNEGPIFFGNRTLYTTPVGFSRINIRMLFIVLEKAIATASKYMLFEFNDEFTRTEFVNMTEPYLRDVQGRRGLYGFKVICDESNNTTEVINNFEFVGTFYLQATRAIETVVLNFVSTRTGVSFEESVIFG